MADSGLLRLLSLIRNIPARLLPKLFLLNVLIQHCTSVCLSSGPAQSSAQTLCMNSTDPNIVNHRLEHSNASMGSSNEWQPLPIVAHQHNDTKFVLSESRSRPRVNLEPGRQEYFVTTKRGGSRRKYNPQSHFVRVRNGKEGRKPLFIPVAAYSITKKRPKKKTPVSSVKQKMAASTISVNQKRLYEDSEDESDDESGVEYDDPEDEYEMRKESAVYGYIHKPEIIEFRGQYYYGGQNEQDSHVNRYKEPMMEYDESQEPYHDRHRVSYMPYDSMEHEPSASTLLLNKLKKVIFYKGITAKGLLLASLPLMLTPMLSYLLTPVVIPITATVAAGRRRKRQIGPDSIPLNATSYNSVFEKPYDHKHDGAAEKKLVEAKILLEYLNKVKPDEKLTTNAVANFLECDGLFLPSNRCLEQLACEFSDVRNENASQLERAVTSIILGHLLNNEFISSKFKKRLKQAALYGRIKSGMCKTKYACSRVLLNQINTIN